MIRTPAIDLWPILPELILVGTGIVVLLWGAIAPSVRSPALLFVTSATSKVVFAPPSRWFALPLVVVIVEGAPPPTWIVPMN